MRREQREAERVFSWQCRLTTREKKKGERKERLTGSVLLCTVSREKFTKSVREA